MKRLILILTIIMAALLCFTACQQTEEEPVKTPNPGVIIDTSATPIPKIELDYDATKYVMDGVTLVKYIGDETEPEIPEGTVIIADSAFRDNEKIKSVTIKETVTTIGNYAFENCKALETVSVPKLVETLGDYCFRGCTALKSAETKTKTVNVGKGCFEGCSALETLTLSSSLTDVKDGICKDCTSLTEINLVAATSIGSYAFYGCKSLAKVNAPACASIGDYAFYGAKAFGTGEGNENAGAFSSALTTLGAEAFEGTAWLENGKTAAQAPAKAADAYIIIGKGVLVYYSGILPEGTENDPEAIKFDTRVKNIGSESVRHLKDKVKTLEIPSTVIRVEKGAFKDFDKLESVKIANTLEVISEEAFADCDALKTVEFAGKITDIGASAFRDCVSLTLFAEVKGSKTAKETATPEPEAEATPDPEASEGEDKGDAAEEEATEKPTEKPTESASTGKTGSKDRSDITNRFDASSALVSVGDYAFSGCKALENLFFNDNLTFIGKEAFSGCSACKNIEFGEKLSKVGANAFQGTPWFDNWKGTEENGNALIVGENVLLKTGEGVEISDTGAASVSATLDGKDIPKDKYYNDKTLYSIVIPGTVKTIGENAFYYAENLYEVIIEDGVEYIDASAFYGCGNLARVTLPSTLKGIGDYAFYGCADLTEIVIPETVTSIGKMAFYNCLKLESVNVPEKVTKIGAFAFTNTYWRENDPAELLIVGDGILIRYNGFGDKATIGSDVKAIAGGSFQAVYRLSELTIHEGITELPEFAVSGCNTLTKIIAKGVTNVGSRAFNYCSSLVTAEFADYYEAAEDAFAGCEVFQAPEVKATPVPTEVPEDEDASGDEEP